MMNLPAKSSHQLNTQFRPTAIIQFNTGINKFTIHICVKYVFFLQMDCTLAIIQEDPQGHYNPFQACNPAI